MANEYLDPVNSLPARLFRRGVSRLAARTRGKGMIALNARLVTLLALATMPAAAVGVVTVSAPWVRPAALHASAPAYLVLGSSEAVTLVAARSPVGDVVIVRGTKRVDTVPVAPGVPFAMQKEREHLLLQRITRKLGPGERVPLTLVLRDAAGALREIDVDAEVRMRSPIDDERRAHDHH